MDNEFINNLERTFNDIISEIDAKNIKYKSNDIKGIIALGYYSKVIEGVKAIIILLKENNLESAIQPIFRSVLEAMIDLDNILNIEGYINYLCYLDLNNKFKLGKKNYLKQISEKQNFDYKETKNKIEKDIINLESKIKSKYGNRFLNNQGKINTSIKFKFELSKNIDIYDSLYWILCTDTHNNISTIEEYYFTPIDEDLMVAFFNTMDVGKQKSVCSTLEKILKDSQNIIYYILEIK